MNHLTHYMKNIIIKLITIYQSSVSLLFPGTCRFTPSCSNYMIESIKKYGIKYGIYNGCTRILRCHPYSKRNHWDPV